MFCGKNNHSMILKKFYNGSLDLHPEELETFNWEEQDQFLNSTVMSNLVIKYPTNSQFTKLFFKKIINILESMHQEVHDDFYSYVCKIMSKDTCKEDYYHKHFIISEDLTKSVVIKETKNIVFNGTTGMKTWEASLLLADWILSHSNEFEEMNILELGSGVGFLGISIATFCKVKSITLSDCNENLLDMIYNNICINFPTNKVIKTQSSYLRASIEKEDYLCQIDIKIIDWFEIEEFVNDINGKPDIILGADITFDPSILEQLCKTLLFFSRKETIIYISSILRNEDTFNKFLYWLDKYNFQYEELSYSHSNFIEWNTSIKKCLLKIKLKS